LKDCFGFLPIFFCGISGDSIASAGDIAMAAGIPRIVENRPQYFSGLDVRLGGSQGSINFFPEAAGTERPLHTFVCKKEIGHLGYQIGILDKTQMGSQ
jgi:hypothetical protein